jgi:transcriptional regulator
MYKPAALVVTDQAALARFAMRHPFATLISELAGDVQVSHVPLLCDVQPLRVRGHLARANPQSQHLVAGCRLKMVFHGPHRYVCPHDSEQAPLLPTWNYAMVHGSGRARVLADDELRQLLKDLVERLERDHAVPWRIESAAPLVTQLFPEIVGFEVQNLTLESALKLTRDRSFDDRNAAIAALTRPMDSVEEEILDLLRRQAASE